MEIRVSVVFRRSAITLQGHNPVFALLRQAVFITIKLSCIELFISNSSLAKQF